jgi:hypothetical protein
MDKNPRIIKAITLWNPWAYLVALAGHPDPEVVKMGKRIETRSWPTKYRGPLAIHAAKAIPDIAEELCESNPFFNTALRAGGISFNGDVPLKTLIQCGAVIATCNLAECCRIGEDGLYRLDPAKIEPPKWFAPLPGEPEISFGDYAPGRYAWMLEDVIMLPEPIPAKGHQGLWNWEPPEGVLIA